MKTDFRTWTFVCTLGLLALGSVQAEDLMRVIRSGEVEALKTLVSTSSPGVVTQTVGTAVSGLHLAAAMNRADMVGVLIQAGAEVNARTANGFTPLHWAAGRDAADALQALLQAGADPTATSQKGLTPLHWAAAQNATQCVSILLQAGVNVIAPSESGSRPLHWAVLNKADASAFLLAEQQVTDEESGRITNTDVVAESDLPIPTVSTGALAVATEPSVHPGVADEADLPLPEVVGAPSPQDPPLPEVPLVFADPNVTGPAPDPGTSTTPPPDVVTLTLDAPTPEGPTLDETILNGRTTNATMSVPLGMARRMAFVWIESLGLWCGRYEVSNGEYRRFRPMHNSLSHEDHTLNENAQPAVYVSWNDATEFCGWLNSRFQVERGTTWEFRLPTRQEWTAVALCGTDRRYPWGNEWPPLYGNFSDLTARARLPEWRGLDDYRDEYVTTAPVKASGVNEWGVFGLAGNVWEWCQDWYGEGQTYKIRCGGSWFFDDRTHLEIAHPGFDRPDARYDHIGFRVIIARRPDPVPEP